jgi:membrane protease YdiL (CAAX protease family)
MTENLLDNNLNTPLIPSRAIDRYSFFAQLFIWLGIFLGCFLLAQMISSLIILSYYKSADIKQIVSNPADLNVLRYAQMLATLFSFLLPALIFSRLKSDSLLQYSKAAVGFNPVFLLLIPLLLITFYPLINVSFFVNKYMFWNDWFKDYQGDYKIIVEGLLKDQSVYVFVLNFITVAVLPAICEEWIFRGTLQKLLTERLNIHIAVFLAALFFSLIHFEFSGFLPRVILGMFLGYLFYYSGSLWASIFAHLVNNGAQVVFIYLNNKGIYKMDVENPEMPQVWELIVYTLAFAGLWSLFYHFAQKRKNSTFV